MSEVEAIKQLTEVVRDEEIIVTIGWLAWGAGMIIIGGLLFMILQRLPQRSMTVEEARKIAQEIIEQLRSNRRASYRQEGHQQQDRQQRHATAHDIGHDANS